MLSEVKSASGGEEEVSDQNEVQLHQPEPFNLRHHLAKEEIKPEKPKRKFSLSLPAILVSIFIFIVTTLAIGIIFYNKQTQTKIASINDFESCAAAGNPIMESYPEKCSANGQTFTRELTEEEQKKLDPTADWKIYTNLEYGISFKYPNTWITDKVFSSSTDTDLPGLHPISNPPPEGSADPIYVQVYSNPENLSFQEWDKKETEDYEVAGANLNKADTKPANLSGLTAFINEKGNCEPYTCEQIIIMGNKNVFVFKRLDMLGAYTEEEINSFKLIFDQIFSTFKFTDQNSATDTSNPNEYQLLNSTSNSGWKTYTNKGNGLSFDFPNYLTKLENNKKYEGLNYFDYYAIIVSDQNTEKRLSVTLNPYQDAGTCPPILQYDGKLIKNKLTYETKTVAADPYLAPSELKGCPKYYSAGVVTESGDLIGVTFIQESPEKYGSPNQQDFEKILSSIKFTN